MEKKNNQLEKVNNATEVIKGLIAERDDLGLALDEIKHQIVDRVAELDKDTKGEFELAQTTEMVDGEVEITYIDMLEQAKDKIKNALIGARNEKKKTDKKRKKKK